MSDFSDLFKNRFDDLPTYQIEIGVIEQYNNRKKKKTINVGITNAELMFIHENGSPAQHIPARPVLEMTIEYANNKLIQDCIDTCTEAFINSNFNKEVIEKELNKLCIRMENYARDIIYSNDGRLKSNSPSVIRRKKGNHPLFDTGQLTRSITCRLIKM